ncbi:MAG: DUF3108 domain-containing protein [Proteobacteria bacterium]|nr:DUF3108 domain-containing protein [Pseudomonadota bacterium]
MHADHARDTNRAAAQRRKVLLVLSAATAALHLALLGVAAPPWLAAPAPGAVAPTSSIAVRMIEPAPEALVPEPAPAVLPAHGPVPAPAPPARTARRAVAHAAPASTGTVPIATETVAPPDVQVALQETVPSSAAPTSAPPAADNEVVPTYRTRPPPTATLRYVMQRGVLRGTGEMTWRNDGDRYELRLDGSVIGINIITQASSGIFDAGGLAPVRFTDQRMRRQAIAANFQRDTGKITFSGPSTEYPIWPGTQDRLSWMMQLCAIAAGDPAVMKPDGRIAMHVVGARGDAQVWGMRYVGRERIETQAGSLMAEKFERVLRDPTDTMAAVWLDPQHHHLPVRATLRNANESDALELSLEQLTVAP